MAAVANRTSTNNSPHLGNRSMTSSPRTTRSTISNTADESKDLKSTSEIKQEAQVPTIKQPEESDTKDAPLPPNAPLAPPPRPNQNGGDNDYFSGPHGQAHFSKEPNPFENAFSNPADTPGKSQLPGVASLTSPASLLPGNTPGWAGSLRSGPLSPAMLTGPSGSNDYFNSDHHFSGGSFPTPNESSLRSGLTPGGGGSMFPQPSPNSQALYNQLQNGGATPGTLDFHRTAMTARAQNHNNNNYHPQPAVTSQPQTNPNIQPDLDSKPYNPNQQNQQQDQQDPFSAHQSNEAANGLFMLANGGGQRGQQQGFSAPQHQQQGYPGMQQPQDQNMNGRAQKNSVMSNLSGGTDNGQGEYSDGSVDTKPARNGRGGKKGSAGKGGSNGKRKTDETPVKTQNKKQRGDNGQAVQSPEDDQEMEDDMEEETGPDGRKMTDEEKRKNFLERNRVAALKCRQRKKQWLANLQQKVEIFSTENDALAATVTQLREEIVGLKTLLLAHKDCPVSQAQGISSQQIQQIASSNENQYANPYGMGMGGPGGMPMQMHGQMQRR